MLCTRDGNISNENIKETPTADRASEQQCYYSTVQQRKENILL